MKRNNNNNSNDIKLFNNGSFLFILSQPTKDYNITMKTELTISLCKIHLFRKRS